MHADRLILWLARRQWRTLLGGAAFGVPWMLSIALVPAAIGQALDEGIVPRDRNALLWWSAAILGLGLVSAVTTDLRHWFAVQNWLAAAFRSGYATDAAIRRAGPALTRTLPTGEVVQVFASDFVKMGHLFDVFARFCGAIASFVVVAIILLRGSTLLGVVVLVGGPLTLAALALLVRPLQRRQSAQRAEAGRLTTLGSDTVGGLRVLRGIGGEETFLARYAAQSQAVRQAGNRLAPVQASLDVSQLLLPSLFVLVVTVIGARLAAAGEITAGQLVAYYGYTAFLTLPLRTTVEFFDRLIATRVASRRVVAVLEVQADHGSSSVPADRAPSLPGNVRVTDPASGVEIEPGQLTALVSARPEDTAAIAARLGRTSPGLGGVTWGTLSLDEVPIGAVREAVVVSESTPHLYSGPVRRELLAGVQRSDEAIAEALQVASAQDALDAVEGGLRGELEERGRALSGGQRQRLALTRALLRDPEVLILVEPTSAVDAHTEARIASRLTEHRRGRTTVLATASPLLLDQADEVLLIEDGQMRDRGRHHDLARRSAAYRSIVLRGED